jgi:hypothetical protein
MLVTGDLFGTLRLPVALGRPLGEHDDREGAPAAAVITDAFWRRAFAGDPAAMGQLVHINGAPVEVVGVTAPAFDGLSRSGLAPAIDVIVPFAAQPVVAPSWKGPGRLREDFTRRWIRIVARVHDGADRERLAAASAAVMARTLADVAPADADLRGLDVRLLPANRGLDGLRNPTAQPLLIVTGVVTIFLIVTCTNLAGMLTARGLARRRELAVRRALGAERWRLVRQALVVSFLLALAGGAAGLLLAIWSGPALSAMLSDGLNAARVGLEMDWPFLGLAAAVTLATALCFGGIPAVGLTRADSTTELRDRPGAGASRRPGGPIHI